MQTSFESTLFLCLFGSAISSVSKHRNCRYSTIPGVLKAIYSHKNIEARSRMDCIRSSCVCNSRCAASFNKKTGKCLSTTLSAVPLSWTKDRLFDGTEENVWVSFVPGNSIFSLPIPDGLWVMDGSFQGQNLGSKGSKLDMSVNKLTWGSVGPLGYSSSLKYARGFTAARPQIQNRHGSNFLLDFGNSFSLAMWVKADNFIDYAVLLDGWNSDEKKWSVSLYMWPSKNLDQITLSTNVEARSTLNETNKLNWRHIAAIKEGTGHYSLYLNGTKWPILFNKPIGYMSSRRTPDVIRVGHYPETDYKFYFKGSIACIAIFERALTVTEVRQYMASCP